MLFLHFACKSSCKMLSPLTVTKSDKKPLTEKLSSSISRIPKEKATCIIETCDSWNDSWNFHRLLSTITACLAQALETCMTYNFIVNLMLGNHSGRDCLRKRRDYYKEGDICCDKLMVLQWKLFTQTLSNKANQYFIAWFVKVWGRVMEFS